MGKKRQKLCCGSCSQVILLEVDGRRVTTIASIPISHSASDIGVETNGDVNDKYTSHGDRLPGLAYPEDFNSVEYDSHENEKQVLPSVSPISSLDIMEKEYGLNLSGSEKRQGLSFSSSTSENLESPNSMVCQRDLRSSAELPFETEAISRLPSLPLHEHFSFGSSNQVSDRSGKGNRSKRTEKEKIVTLDANLRHNSVKDIPIAIEMDFLADEYEYPIPGFSQESLEADKDEDE